MAEHNLAIQVDPPDDDIHDTDVECGFVGSRSHLIQPFEEDRAQSVSVSIQRSLQSTIRKSRYYCSFITSPIKKVLLKFKLLIVIAIYSVFGAWLFTTLEVPHDLAMKEEAYHGRLIARDVMILNLRAIHQSNKEDREERWKDAVLRFEQDLGLDEPSIETAWTFWMAFLYAGTIYTTIGYGNIACQTVGGQVATLIYAFVGIPIMIIILNDLGDFLLKWVKLIAAFSSDSCLYLGVRWGMVTLEEGSKSRARFLAFSRKLARAGIGNATSVSTVATTSGSSEDDEEPIPDPPVLSALFATFGWIFLSAGVFCLWEDWTYFTSIYFFFISCSTIGLGDVVPAHPEYMIFAFGVVMVGLSLVTVCINVVQEKLELMYMALLQKLLDDYMAAVESGDPNAASGMMSGFQGRAKFLMPLMSKNQGAKVMNQFKDDCVAKGIDPPAVLTDIDPTTGMPAFASADKDDFKDYIEHAEEKRADERRVEEERIQSRSPHTMRRNQLEPVAPRDTSSLGTQTLPPQRTVDRHSFNVQFSPELSDGQSQTDNESTDEGIQTWPSSEDISVQYDAVQFKASWSQYEMLEERPSSAIQVAPVLVSTGIQPEVSSIYFAENDVSSSDESSSSQSEDDQGAELDDHDEIEEPMEHYADLLTISVPAVQRLQRKSISEESQDTIIHISPSESPQSRRRTVDERRRDQKEKRAREREERRDARRLAKGLRFMKSSGDQTTPDLSEFGIQTEYLVESTACQHTATTAECSTQHYVELKGQRSQTRLTSITTDHHLTRRTSLRRRRSTQRSSRTSATSDPDTSSSYDQMQKRPSLVSIDESLIESEPSPSAFREGRSPWETSMEGAESLDWGQEEGNLPPEDRIHTEEVSVDLCLVSRPVDEFGRIVIEKEEEMRGEMDEMGEESREGGARALERRVTWTDELERIDERVDGADNERGEEGEDMMMDDDVFGSDVDLDEDDLELFSTSCETQTQAKEWEEAETQASAAELDLLSTVVCQTELTTMRVAKKKKAKRNPPKTERKKKEKKKKEEAPSLDTSGKTLEQIVAEIKQAVERKESNKDEPEEESSECVPSTAESATDPGVSFVETESDVVESQLEDDEDEVFLEDEMEDDYEDEEEEDEEGGDEEEEEEHEDIRFLQETEVQTMNTSFYAPTPEVAMTSSGSQADELACPPAGPSPNFLVDAISQTSIMADQRQTQTDVLSRTDIVTQTEIESDEKVRETATKECTDEEVQTEEEAADITTEETQTEEPVRDIIDGETQTMEKYHTDGETQTRKTETGKTVMQTTTEYAEESEIQTEREERRESEMQTEREEKGDSVTQTDREERDESETQTVIEERDESETQTDREEKEETEAQTVIEERDESETQTHIKELMERDAQTVVEVMVTEELETQTEEKEQKQEESQTEEAESVCESRETQTPRQSTSTAVQPEQPPKELDESGSQTQMELKHESVQCSWSSASSAVDATQPLASTVAQSDVSMFVVEQKDRSKLETAHGVRFNVNSASGMDERRTREVETQGSIRVECDSVSCQATPILTTSHTQHAYACLSDQAAQTDLLMKNKRSQDVDTVAVEFCDVGTDAVYVTAAELSVQTAEEEAVTVAEWGTKTGMQTEMLWSDFDPVVDIVQEESSESDIQTPRETSELETQTVIELAELETQTVLVTEELETQTDMDTEELETQTLVMTEELETQTYPDLTEGESQTPVRETGEGETQTMREESNESVQAVVDTDSVGIGQEGREDWVKVYVAELDLERRLKMLDIGIQTGVLARVQHMYGKREPSLTETEQGTSEMPRVSVRKTVSNEQLAGSQKRLDGSEESLARTSSVMSIAESIDESPTSKASSRSSSFKKPRRARDRDAPVGEKTVSDLRSRFEKKSTRREGRTRSSSAER